MPATERRLVGSVIAGNFRIERQLGRGAMGEVYLAEQISLGKKIAIKVLHRHLQGDEGLAKRFHREAKAASSLSHSNILQIIDFGQSGEELFIAMELLHGRDLAKVMEEQFPLPLERVVRIMGQVLSALDEAHALNIIHRDLKPENIMVMDRRGERDFVKVCDFGIAKIQDPKTDGASGTITMAGVVCGTPEYMSPEQCRGERLDGRADLYSVGVILYQMATGVLPFTAESALGIVTKQLTENPIPPRQRRPDLAIDPRLEALILRAMSKDRGKRPASGAAMKEELEEILRQPRAAAPAPLKGLSMMVPIAAQPEARTASLEAAIASDLPSLRARPRWVLPVVGLALAGLAVVLLRPRARPAHPVDTSGASAVQSAPAKQTAKAQAPPVAPTPELVAALPSGVQEPARGAPAAPSPGVEEKTRAAPSTRSKSERKTPTRRIGAEDLLPPRESPPSRASGRPQEVAFQEGKRLFDLGRTREAIARYLEALRIDGGYAPAYKALGQAYMRVGNTDEGRRYYRRYLDLHPEDVFVRAIVEK